MGQQYHQMPQAPVPPPPHHHGNLAYDAQPLHAELDRMNLDPHLSEQQHGYLSFFKPDDDVRPTYECYRFSKKKSGRQGQAETWAIVDRDLLKNSQAELKAEVAKQKKQTVGELKESFSARELYDSKYMVHNQRKQVTRLLRERRLAANDPTVAFDIAAILLEQGGTPRKTKTMRVILAKRPAIPGQASRPGLGRSRALSSQTVDLSSDGYDDFEGQSQDSFPSSMNTRQQPFQHYAPEPGYSHTHVQPHADVHAHAHAHTHPHAHVHQANHFAPQQQERFMPQQQEHYIPQQQEHYIPQQEIFTGEDFVDVPYPAEHTQPPNFAHAGFTTERKGKDFMQHKPKKDKKPKSNDKHRKHDSDSSETEFGSSDMSAREERNRTPDTFYSSESVRDHHKEKKYHEKDHQKDQSKSRRDSHGHSSERERERPRDHDHSPKVTREHRRKSPARSSYSSSSSRRHLYDISDVEVEPAVSYLRRPDHSRQSSDVSSRRSERRRDARCVTSHDDDTFHHPRELSPVGRRTPREYSLGRRLSQVYTPAGRRPSTRRSLTDYAHSTDLYDERDEPKEEQRRRNKLADEKKRRQERLEEEQHQLDKLKEEKLRFDRFDLEDELEERERKRWEREREAERPRAYLASRPEPRPRYSFRPSPAREMGFAHHPRDDFEPDYWR